MIAYEIKNPHSNITNIMQILIGRVKSYYNYLFNNMATPSTHEHLYTLYEYSHRLKEDCTLNQVCFI